MTFAELEFISILEQSVCKVPYPAVKRQSEILTGLFHEFEAGWKCIDKFISTKAFRLSFLDEWHILALVIKEVIK